MSMSSRLFRIWCSPQRTGTRILDRGFGFSRCFRETAFRWYAAYACRVRKDIAITDIMRGFRKQEKLFKQLKDKLKLVSNQSWKIMDIIWLLNGTIQNWFGIPWIELHLVKEGLTWNNSDQATAFFWLAHYLSMNGRQYWLKLLSRLSIENVFVCGNHTCTRLVTLSFSTSPRMNEIKNAGK